MLTDFLLVLTYALLPAAGNLMGVALAERLHSPRWVIGAALHGAAGIAIALVAVDLMPRILEAIPMWIIVIAFLFGAGFSLLLWQGARALRGQFGGTRTGALMVYIVIGADLFSDGLMTGAGSAITSDLGLLIGMTQAVANIPGGFATTKNLQDNKVPRGRRWLLCFFMFLLVAASATMGFWLLGGQNDFVQHAALAFIVGLLLLATIEDMIPEGDRPQPSRWISTLSFAGGFVGLSLAVAYLSL